MSDIAIQVKNLSKQYTIGEAENQYDTFRDQLVEGVKALFRRAKEPLVGRKAFWAIKDVSFEVKEGEVVGIIGNNGAGKSTLLKILSRITEPTVGYAELRGRVGSLLEVGTGFHPELSGRENIYLNGAILGMRKSEIDRKFDEIVEFSEIKKFLDMPVKRYSSGMHMRLAFAVAAHLDPEILIVDEVLAVGDVAFQRKCLGKMQEVAHTGRTVLFVSHNIATVNELCSRAILLQNGEIIEDGPPKDVLESYLRAEKELARIEIAFRKDRTGSGLLRFTQIRCLVKNEEVSCIESGQNVCIELLFKAPEPVCPQNVRFAITFLSLNSIRVLSFDSLSIHFEPKFISTQGIVCCHIPKLPLIRGIYRANVYASINGEVADRVENAFEIEVLSNSFPRNGYFVIDHTWSIEEK